MKRLIALMRASMKWVTVMALVCCHSALAAPPPPNILFAIADDWGLHAGAYGTRWVKTPAVDRIARE
jgi:hypothetical protein